MTSSEPDQPAGQEPEQVRALKFRCPNDGSTDVYWEIERGQLVCMHCRTVVPEGPRPAGGHVLNGIVVSDGVTQALPEDNICNFKCEGCGAEVVSDKSTSMSAKCSWCRNNLIPGDVVSNEFTPDGIIPFAVSEAQAVDSFQRWVKKHWFVRKGFGDVKNVIVKPVYYPFYVLDARVDASIDTTGERLVRSYSRGNYDYRDYEQFRLQGPASGYVDDQERVALNEVVNEKIVNLVRPYDWTEPRLRPFNYRYLNGFNAEHRDIDFNTISRSVGDEGVAAVTSELSNRLGTKVSPTIMGYNPVIGYVLAPVWLLTYVDAAEGKTYFFAINGQNGRSAGVLPVDWKKSAVFIVACTAIMAAASFALEYLRLKGLAG
ncbi:MAG: TFIIB-type zinc ribbon-containing protein [Micrococcales bacterium]|nr:TFIIB-type zinc ribbon-containing protein [Micrococcales bacterium]MCL2667774.1 TFIIB-type zinc ribbon-containing protein [Micrococcales bacterium]